MKKIILSISLTFVLPFMLYSQSNNLVFNIGSGFSKPEYAIYADQNCFGIYDERKHRFPDIDFFININKAFSIAKYTTARVGLGYSLLVSKTEVPISNRYFDIGAKVYISSQLYEVHKIQIPIGLNYAFYKRNNALLSLVINGTANVAFLKFANRSMNSDSFTNNLSKWQFSPYSLEGFGGLLLQQKCIEYQLDCRFFNGKFRDDAIAIDVKRFDLHNPFKMRFSVGYRF